MVLGYVILLSDIGVIFGSLLALIDIRREEMEKNGLEKMTRWEVFKEELKSVFDEFQS